MLDKLYDNIGGKIKGWAKWMFVIESIIAVIAGIAMIVSDVDMFFAGLLVIVFGPIVAFVSTWLLYGFGEIIDYLELIEDRLDEYTSKKANRKSFNEPVKKETKKVSVQPVTVKNNVTAGTELAHLEVDEDSFFSNLMNMSADDLLLILQDQRDLYSEEEYDRIKEIYHWKIKH